RRSTVARDIQLKRRQTARYGKIAQSSDPIFMERGNPSRWKNWKKVNKRNLEDIQSRLQSSHLVRSDLDITPLVGTDVRSRYPNDKTSRLQIAASVEEIKRHLEDVRGVFWIWDEYGAQDENSRRAEGRLNPATFDENDNISIASTPINDVIWFSPGEIRGSVESASWRATVR